MDYFVASIKNLTSTALLPITSKIKLIVRSLKMPMVNKITLAFKFLKHIYVYILDMVNDILLWLYFNDRIQYLEGSSYVIALIWFKFGTIFMAQIIMGIYLVSVKNELYPTISNSRIKNSCFYFLLLVSAPLVPCSLALKAVALEDQKQNEIEREAKESSPRGSFVYSPSLAWLKGRLYDEKIEKVNSAIATFHFITASFETIPEVWILLTFLVTRHNGDIVVIQDNAVLFWVFTVITILTILYALVTATDLRKRGRLDIKQKVFLLLSYFFQVAARLSLMTASSSHTIDYVNGKTVEMLDEEPYFGLYDLFYIFVPFFVHWGLLWILYHVSIPWLPLKQFSKRTPYADRIMHVLSNTFIVVPLDEKEETSKGDLQACLEQEREETSGSEVVILLLLTGLELEAQLVVGHLLKFWSFKNNFCCKVNDWGIWLFPICSWAIGCLFMLLFYRYFHTWSGSLPKKLSNFHFENDCRDCCHINRHHGWCQQCTTSKLPERSKSAMPIDQKTTQDYHAHDSSLPERSEIFPAQRQKTISYSSTSFSHVSIGYLIMAS